MKKDFYPKVFLYSMLLLIIILLGFIFLPYDDGIRRNLFPVAAFLAFVFMGLGIALMVGSRKQKKPLKYYLLIAGISAITVPLGSILHNVFYAFAVLSEGIVVLEQLMQSIHAAFFILSVLGAPIVFLICSVFSIYYLKRPNIQKTSKKIK